MTHNTHDRSWSFGDQSYMPFTYTNDGASWIQDGGFNWQFDISEHQNQHSGDQVMLQPPIWMTQGSPSADTVNISTYGTSLPTSQGYHSPMLVDSNSATTPSNSSVSIMSTSTQASPYQEPAGLLSPRGHPSTMMADTNAPIVTGRPQQLLPAMPASSNTNPGIFGSPEMTTRPRPPSPRTREMSQYGVHQGDGCWTCRFDRCSSQSRFHRPCDLRKHYQRHLTRFYCNYPDCQEAEGNGQGFATRKDRARHEQSHDPKIICEWPTCNKIFSRRDNMRDHVKRIHMRPRPRRRATTAN